MEYPPKITGAEEESTTLRYIETCDKNINILCGARGSEKCKSCAWNDREQWRREYILQTKGLSRGKDGMRRLVLPKKDNVSPVPTKSKPNERGFDFEKERLPEGGSPTKPGGQNPEGR